MITSEKASFSLDSFKVPKFSYDEGNDNGSNIKIGFSPSGKYNSSNGEFELTLLFISHEEEEIESVIFQLTAIAVFKFDRNLKLSEIPSYFYMNAIAIMFPYLRAFISTLTLQANTKLMNLGLMNLSKLEKPLRENTIEI